MSYAVKTKDPANYYKPCLNKPKVTEDPRFLKLKI